MGKKRNKKFRPAKKTFSAPAQQGATRLLREAIGGLRLGNTNLALRLASQALETTNSPAVATTARQMLAEAHFRAAMNSNQTHERLQHLETALQYTPDAPRVHFYRGVTLWQLGRLPEALPEFDFVAAREPQRPGLAYLRQLARLAAGQSWESDGLSPAEANTLRLVQGLLQGDPPARLLTLLQQPVLGKGPQMWQALIEMQNKATAASLDLFKTAAEKAGRKSVGRILYYYRGVAAMRRGDRETARAAWITAKSAGLATPWLDQNLGHLLREQVLELAQAGRWQEIANLGSHLPVAVEDRVLTEILGLAYYHLGYEAAQAGRWSTAAEHWRKASQHIHSRSLAQNLALAEEALENWGKAAEAWREMVRRRPRKANHPDSLTDAQVAAIWSHTAECYERIGQTDEAITCLRNALKYAPDDAALRLKLVDALMGVQRQWVAEGELQQILESNPQHVEALIRLGKLYQESWNRDPLPIWRRVLAADPENVEAREALAQLYIERVRGDSKQGLFAFLWRGPQKDKIKLLEEGLQDLPEHPALLLELGTLYAEARQSKPAREYLLRAFRADPNHTKTAGSVIHELLHVNAGDAVEELMTQVRQMQDLLPTFWVEQGKGVLHCKLGRAWAVRFFDEAIALTRQPHVTETKAGVLVDICEAAHTENDLELARQYEQRIRSEAPASGALEYIEAFRLFHDRHDRQGALRLLRKARQMARKANDASVMERAEMLETFLQGGMLELMNLLGGLDEELEDEFEAFF